MNKVIMVGRITKDSELIQLEGSTRSVIKFVLAVNRRFSKKNEERDADFISVVYWSNYGDKIQPYLLKGKLIGISGKITTRSYTGADGSKKYITEVEADNIQFLENKKENLVQENVM
ncbi:single-stranded DNA-binding protein [Clostridium magnum]|uniref:Single-stranded DNA-binding protein n=1 Tax=Clostridium magnum DSM 2767 TaxID=1121326 RepID=A0A162UNV1_9CLOT|nr:single-stranded DNA-binding protein [Clostridium magnum]KZL94124.1 single-stranded DNA-binding protein A [Clostridium magnum DSM 2767]SHH94607.1 single-strand DNA-binding protein [Clostridium magnum DSM 2767]